MIRRADALPGIGRELLEPERDAVLLWKILEHLHLEFLAYPHHFGRMSDAAPREDGNVQQSVHPSQIDKSSIVHQVLHPPGQNRAFYQLSNQLAAAPVELLLQRR